MELLVVVSITGLLIGLLMPTVQGAREAGRRATCVNSLRQLGLALLNYEAALKTYPPGRTGGDGLYFPENAGMRGWQFSSTSGFVLLLPMLEDQSLYDQFEGFRHGAVSPSLQFNADDRLVAGWQTANVARAIATRPAWVVCPSDDAESLVTSTNVPGPAATFATGSYAFVQGSHGPSLGIDPLRVKYHNNGMFGYRYAYSSREATDGLSRTMFVGETVAGHVSPALNTWTTAWRYLSSLRSAENPLNTPIGGGTMFPPGTPDNPGANGAFASRHPGGGSFVFGDGRVAFVSEQSDLDIYWALATRANED